MAIVLKKAFKAAWPQTIPIFTGFVFLGFSYGVLMRSQGFGVFFPILMSLTILAGSMEFATVSLLLGGFDPIKALLMTLMINGRHLFYGISMLEKYKNTGLKKLYLIFGLCDETFSINYTANVPEGVDEGWFMFFVTLLNHFYWVLGASLGAVFGSCLHFDFEGLEFVMTALFIVIFLEQWNKDDSHHSSIIGIVSAILCLLVFGSESFMIPTMIVILSVLLLLRGGKRMEIRGDIHESA